MVSSQGFGKPVARLVEEQIDAGYSAAGTARREMREAIARKRSGYEMFPEIERGWRRATARAAVVLALGDVLDASACRRQRLYQWMRRLIPQAAGAWRPDTIQPGDPKRLSLVGRVRSSLRSSC